MVVLVFLDVDNNDLAVATVGKSFVSFLNLPSITGNEQLVSTRNPEPLKSLYILLPT